MSRLRRSSILLTMKSIYNHFAGEDEELWDTSEGVRVLGISYSDDEEEASYGALINMQGEVADFIKLSFLTKRENSYIEKERLGKVDDMVALRKFIKTRRPHVIALSAIDMSARNVQGEVERVLQDLSAQEEFPEGIQVTVSLSLCSDWSKDWNTDL